MERCPQIYTKFTELPEERNAIVDLVPFWNIYCIKCVINT